MVFKLLSEDQMIIGGRKKLYFWGIHTQKLSNPLGIFTNTSKPQKDVFNLKDQNLHQNFITNILYLPQKKILITGSDDMTLKAWDFQLHSFSLKHIKTIEPSNAVKNKSLIDDFLYLPQFDSLLVANRNYGITIFKVSLIRSTTETCEKSRVSTSSKSE